MPTVGIHSPKTPVTLGSNGLAAATIPNICKMPGAPPFVPTPLPNIGMSSLQPLLYSLTVKIEATPVAIGDASFGSVGDIASLPTGGGVVSSNAHGPTKFISPGSLTVQIESKSVHLLSDIMSNNNGPAGSPPNAATMGGVLQGPSLRMKAAAAGVTQQAQEMCDAYCVCKAAGTPYQTCVDAAMYAKDAAQNWQDPLKTEIPFDMSKNPPAAYQSTEHPRPTSWRIRPGRRPDAIVVNDVNADWKGSNIKAVIECKWGPDSYNPGQREAYVRIAGSEDRLIEMDDQPGSENECRCEDEERREPVPVPVPVPRTEEEEQRTEWRLPDLRPVAPVLVVLGLIALAVAAVVTAPASLTVAAAVLVVGGLAASSTGPAGENPNVI